MAVVACWRDECYGGDEDKAITAIRFSGHKDTESPIEALIGGAIEGTASNPLSKEKAPWLDIIVRPQVKIGKYRIDLAVYQVTSDGKTLTASLIIAVECDGHEFHERTKEQAARDRRRDRWFLSQGIPVMRFTGSEIFNDCWQCAGDVVRQAVKYTKAAA